MIGAVLPSEAGSLGHLEIDEVFEEHDAVPVFFTCRNEMGSAFLVIAADSDESGDVFLYLPTSEDRLIALRTGLTPLRTGYLNPEWGRLAVVRPGRSNPEQMVEYVSPDSVDPDWLPEASVVLTAALDTAIRFTPERLSQMSRQQRRPLSALEFAIPSGRRTEMPLSLAGPVLTEIQKLADVMVERDRPEARGHVRFDVMRESELSLTGLMAASFVFVLAPYAPADSLIPQPSVAMELVAGALNAVNLDGDAFNESIQAFSKRTISHIRDFLISVEQASSGITLVNSAPTGVTDSVSVSLPQVRTSLAALRSRLALPSESYELSVHLIAINHERLTFGIEETAATGTRRRPRKFFGHFDRSLLEVVDGLATGPSTAYRVKILEEKDAPAITGGTPKKKLRMLEIAPATSQLSGFTQK
jgi:hypothetical protein